MAELRFDVYKDAASEWRWRLVSPNGRVIADSSEGYKNYVDCQDGIRLVKQAFDAPVQVKRSDMA